MATRGAVSASRYKAVCSMLVVALTVGAGATQPHATATTVATASVGVPAGTALASCCVSTSVGLAPTVAA